MKVCCFFAKFMIIFNRKITAKPEIREMWKMRIGPRDEKIDETNVCKTRSGRTGHWTAAQAVLPTILWIIMPSINVYMSMVVEGTLIAVIIVIIPSSLCHCEGHSLVTGAVASLDLG